MLVALAYLHVVGAPDSVHRFLVDQLAQKGVAAQFGAIRLELFRGVVATDAVLGSVDRPGEALVQIDEVQLVVDWNGLRQRRNAIRALHIANARLAVPLPADEQGGAVFTAERAYATFQFEPDGAIRVERLTGLYLGIRLFVAGRFKPAPPGPSPATGAPESGQAFRLLTRVVRELNRLRAGTTPQLELDFDVDLADPLAGSARVSLQGSDWEYRGLRVDSARLIVELQAGAVRIRQCEAQLAGGTFKVAGHYDLRHGSFDVTVHSTTDPAAFLVLAPPEAVALADQVSFGQNPRIDVQYRLLPEIGTLPELLGSIDVRDVSVRGVAFRLVHAQFEVHGPEVIIRQAEVVTPEGRLTGQGRYHLESSDFSYHVDSRIDPIRLMPLLGPGVRRILAPAWFDTPPHVVADVRADFVDPDNFAYDATVNAGRCRYRGVELTSARGRLRLRTNQLDAREVVLTRPEGDVRGRLYADFPRQTVTFDLAVTAHPPSLAPLLGPRAPAVIRPYRFGPQTDATTHGLIDFAAPARTVWEASVRNEGFAWWKLQTANAAAQLVFSNQVLRIDDFTADAYDGRLRAACVVDLNLQPAGYRASLVAEDCGVSALLRDLDAGGSDDQGLLTGQLSIRGQGADLGTMEGEGNLEIRDGVLLEMPLFGIFSAILEDLSPGLGQTKLTRATARFAIRNSRVKTDDAEAAAGVFTLKARGSTSFDGSLDYRIQAQLFRAVPGLNIPGIILGKMLEYKVGGTLGAPNYRPLRLPKELLPHRSGDKNKKQENDPGDGRDPETTESPDPVELPATEPAPAMP